MSIIHSPYGTPAHCPPPSSLVLPSPHSLCANPTVLLLLTLWSPLLFLLIRLVLALRTSSPHLLCPSCRRISGPHICGDAVSIDKTGTQILTGSWRRSNTLQVRAGEGVPEVPLLYLKPHIIAQLLMNGCGHLMSMSSGIASWDGGSHPGYHPRWG